MHKATLFCEKAYCHKLSFLVAQTSWLNSSRLLTLVLSLRPPTEGSRVYVESCSIVSEKLTFLPDFFIFIRHYIGQLLTDAHWRLMWHFYLFWRLLGTIFFYWSFFPGLFSGFDMLNSLVCKGYTHSTTKLV